MAKASNVLVPLLLLAVVGGGAAYYASTQGGSEPAPIVAPTPTPAKPVEPTPAPQPVRPVTAQAHQEPERTAVVANTTESDAPQGVRGRVLLPDGRPAAKVPVMLVENFMNDAIRIFLINRGGKSNNTMIAASGVTADDGSFALGVRQLGKAFDLRIVSPDHPEKNVPQIKVREGDWFQVQDQRLEQGLVVHGHVLEEDTQRGIANATVWLAANNQAHTMIATPGRERGISAVTDDKGFYRFTAAPTQGLVTLTAEAEGFASSPVENRQLEVDAPNEINIMVVAGQPIVGVIVDPSGNPIVGATVTANGLSQKTPQAASVTSGAEGKFEFPSLRNGPYNVVGSMAGYVDAREQPVMAGDTEVKLVLGVRPSVKLRVLGANRAPVKSYRLALMRYFPNNPAGVGKVLDFPDRNVTPGDYPAEFNGEWAVIRNVPPGEFRWQIADNAHAKTLSPPFTVVENGTTPEVVAELTLGGVLTGTVIDDTGKPVPDATVSTDMNGGAAADIGLLDLFKSMMPEKHTKTSVKTDAQGRFRITKLAFADYMVRVAHPAFCEGVAIDIKLETPGQVLDVGVVQLARGAVVEGITFVAGQPMGQVKVQLSSPMPAPVPPVPGQPVPEARPMPTMFHAQAVSDGDGHYRLLKRVPPGTYKVTASRETAENPFFKMIDMKDTEQEIVIAPGQERAELNFNLVKR